MASAILKDHSRVLSKEQKGRANQVFEAKPSNTKLLLKTTLQVQYFIDFSIKIGKIS